MTEQPMQVRVIEGNDPFMAFDAGLELEFYDSLLPESLNQNKDRCDICQAEAHHAFVMTNGLPLLACSHDARETIHNAGVPYLAHRDYRTPMDEWVIQRKAAMEAALKAIEAKKLDDSNFDAGTSMPLHKARWDERYWRARD